MKEVWVISSRTSPIRILTPTVAMVSNSTNAGPVMLFLTSSMSRWVEMTLPPREVKLAALEAQTHRRFVKTHLPVVFSARAKYIYVARDGRDIVWSLYNHHWKFVPQFYGQINCNPACADLPRLDPPPESVLQYFQDWLDRDGYPFWSFWENVRSWWSVRDLPNVRLQHFARLKADMPGEIRAIAEFLDIPIDPSMWPAILEHTSFDYMKDHAEKIVPLGGELWQDGAQTFIHRGTNGHWKDVLGPDEVERYETRAREELGQECAHWLATGLFPSAH
jgi:aryl sulfotransferase